MFGRFSLDYAGGFAIVVQDFVAFSYTVGDFNGGNPRNGGCFVDDIGDVLDG